MTAEEREKAIQIMVDRYMSKGTYGDGDRAKWISYATKSYKLYSDENLLKLILTPS